MEMRAVWQRLYRQHDAEVQLSLLSSLCLSRCFLLSFPLLLSRCLLVHPSLLLFSHIRLRVWLIFMFLSFWCNMIYSFRFGFSFSSYFFGLDLFSLRLVHFVFESISIHLLLRLQSHSFCLAFLSLVPRSSLRRSCLRVHEGQPFDARQTPFSDPYPLVPQISCSPSPINSSLFHLRCHPSTTFASLIAPYSWIRPLTII